MFNLSIAELIGILAIAIAIVIYGILSLGSNINDEFNEVIKNDKDDSDRD